jgi:GNAT superfamily N-acetyltransferase
LSLHAMTPPARPLWDYLDGLVAQASDVALARAAERHYRWVPSMDINVRRAEARDIERIAIINAEVQELHVSRRPDQFRPASAEDLLASVDQLVRGDSGLVWVAERGDRVLAYAVVSVRETGPGPHLNTRTWWELDAIGVDAAHRRSGLGRALVEQIQAEARAASVGALELVCWDFNHDALGAFSKLGFRPKLVRLELPLTE